MSLKKLTTRKSSVIVSHASVKSMNYIRSGIQIVLFYIHILYINGIVRDLCS